MKNFKDHSIGKINLFPNLPLNRSPERSYYCGKRKGFEGKEQEREGEV